MISRRWKEKSGDSQCCQFVLFPNEETKQFDFSKRNKVPKSDNCKRIITYMNSNISNPNVICQLS